MGIAMCKNRQFILLGAATSMVAASAIRRLSASCGLVLLTQVLTRTTWGTIVAMSSQPTTITVRAGFQSAVSPNTLFIIKNLPETALFGRFSFWVFFVGTSFSKEVPRLGAWQGEEERRSPVATGWANAPRDRAGAPTLKRYLGIIIRKKNQNSPSTPFFTLVIIRPFHFLT